MLTTILFHIHEKENHFKREEGKHMKQPIDFSEIFKPTTDKMGITKEDIENTPYNLEDNTQVNKEGAYKHHDKL